MKNECLGSAMPYQVSNFEIDNEVMTCPHCERRFKVRFKAWSTEDHMRRLPKHARKANVSTDPPSRRSARKRLAAQHLVPMTFIHGETAAFSITLGTLQRKGLSASDVQRAAASLLGGNVVVARTTSAGFAVVRFSRGAS